jgi:S-methylmethionine-dependent homocysteine/selenocysteine methylase
VACRTDGKLFSGETVAEAVEALGPLNVVGLLVNCTPATTIHEPFAELLRAARRLELPPPLLGLYANIGRTTDVPGWTDTADASPIEYARLAAGWIRLGANLVGGCCGTTPAHISALRAIMP